MGSYLIPPFRTDGMLPHGRFRSDTIEAEKALVRAPAFEGSTTRTDVWNDLNTLIALIHKKRVRVPALFLGGGFTTSAMNPSDVDASILVDGSRISSPTTWNELNKIMTWLSTDPKPLKVDAFLISWYPSGDEYLIPDQYLRERGKWDDWWQRYVPKADRNPPQRHHAMPVRGYLEVIVDDYS